MRAGRLEHLITIQQETQSGVDRLRQPVTAWGTWRTAFAGMTARRGQERFENGQRYNEDVVRFEFRSEDVDGVEPSMRLVAEDGKVYNIKNIMPDYDRRSNTLIDAAVLDVPNAR